MLLNYIFNLIEEGKTAKKRGFRFKEVTDPKTGKSMLFQVVRGAAISRKNGDIAISTTHTPTFTKTASTIRRKEDIKYRPTEVDHAFDHIRPVKTFMNTVNGVHRFPSIRIRDPHGRTHPGAFYHEIGHQLRNTPEMNDDSSPIRKEKTAWQGAKEISPDNYKMAKDDGTIHKGFGSYVSQIRASGSLTKEVKRTAEQQEEYKRKGWDI